MELVEALWLRLRELLCNYSGISVASALRVSISAKRQNLWNGFVSWITSGARHLIDLHKEYCAANPTEDIDLDAYLALVEKSPHPENEPTEAPPTTEGDRDEYADETLDDKLIAYGARTESSRRKDLMIDALLEAIAKLRWILLILLKVWK